MKNTGVKLSWEPDPTFHITLYKPRNQIWHFDFMLITDWVWPFVHGRRLWMENAHFLHFKQICFRQFKLKMKNMPWNLILHMPWFSYYLEYGPSFGRVARFCKKKQKQIINRPFVRLMHGRLTKIGSCIKRVQQKATRIP